jgi:hypothetical protein
MVNGYQKLIATPFFICSQSVSVSFVCFVEPASGMKVSWMWMVIGYLVFVISKKLPV